MKRGYFGIGIYQTKTAENVGTLWRSAHNFGAAFIFTIGHRYQRQAADTTKAACAIPLFTYGDFAQFQANRPSDTTLVGIEQTEEARDLRAFIHPERAIYLLGAEDRGLPIEILDRCGRIVSVSTPMCLNVAVAGSIVLYDRHAKQRDN